MSEPVNINKVAKLNLGLQETDEVFITRGGSGPYRVPASSFPWQRKGDKGDQGLPGEGWAPVLVLASDGPRLVHRIMDWVGGTGIKPTLTGYVSAAGIVTAAADAVDVRGMQGLRGWSPVLAVVADGLRRVQQVVDWVGGAGVKPDATGFIGISGIVALAADAVDLRGPVGSKGDTGSAGWSPVLATIADGVRRVLQVVGWTGGSGMAPTAVGYIGATGIVAAIADAVDVRGAQGVKGDTGAAGWSPVLAVVADGERRVQRVVGWVGGEGGTPTATGYIGAAGIVATAAAAVDIRGAQGGISASGVHAIVDLVIVSASSAMTAVVSAFLVSGYAFSGSSIAMPGSGTWYVGVELSSGVLRVLPRLGHRGWIPVACVVCTAAAITSLQQISPALPGGRLPRTMKKLLSGLPVSVVVMGSSLTASGGAATDWPGMVFGAGTTDKYKLPVAVTCQYTGVGGSPSGYQHAQLGFATANNNYGFSDAGFSFALITKAPPNGRSQLLSGVDVVVIGCLANGGDFRLELIEPMIRQLRKRGVEVVVVTDNPQNPSTDYAAMSSALLYSDGPELMRIADLYGVEIADTAGYVFEAHIRAGGAGIYSDSIHQTSGIPIGPAALLPASGHEAWARAVRSVFPAKWGAATTTTTNSAWSFDSTAPNWYAYGSSSLSVVSGKLVTTTTATASGVFVEQAGGVAVGDTITVTYDIVTSGITALQVGGQGPSGWNSNLVAPTLSGTTVTTTLTVTQAHDRAIVIWYASVGTGTMTLDNVSLAVTRAGLPLVTDQCPGRPADSRQLPPVRVVTDYRTPGDTYVTLPADERQVAFSQATMGTLSAHPWGSKSFARRFSSSVSATQDLLTLAVGKKAMLSADCVVGMSLVHYREVADGACTFNVNINGTLNKTMTVPAVPFSNEWYFPIFTPTELNAIGPAGGSINSIEIEVTAGTLKIAALVASTADIDYMLSEQIMYVGMGWGAKEFSRSGLPGRWTDTFGDYAVANCIGRRLMWLLSANPGSKMVTYRSGQEQLVNQAVSGNYHIKTSGGLLSQGNHVVLCTEANTSGSQSNGHALHIGGAIVINDR